MSKSSSTYKISSGTSIFLDWLRGASAQIVVIGHGISFFGIFNILREPNFPFIQNMAVLVFFLLSGFLIPYSTYRKEILMANYSFVYYLIDRSSRIFVAFIPALLFVLLIDLFSIWLNPDAYNFYETFNLRTFIGNLIMLQDHCILDFIPTLTISSFGSARPFWTLAIEWWIYLFFGYLYLVILYKPKIRLSNIFVLLIFSIAPIYNMYNGRGIALTTYWIFGSLIYLSSREAFVASIREPYKFIIGTFLLILGMIRAKTVMNAFDPIFAFLLAFSLLMFIDVFRNVRFPIWLEKLIRINASYSYTLYLIHYSILAFIKAHYGSMANPYVLFIVGFIIANLVSFSIGYFTEMRLTKVIKSFLYDKVSAIDNSGNLQRKRK